MLFRSRTFVPHKCHAAIGVLGAVTVATACVIPGSVAQGIVSMPPGSVKRLSVEHPSGEFLLEFELEEGIPGQVKVTRSSLIRTARALFRGEILIPAGIWDKAAPETATNVRTMEHA